MSDGAYRMTIGGRWVDGRDHYDVRNPSDRRDVVGQAPCATKAEITESVEAARRAFGNWGRRSMLDRAAFLAAAADVVGQRETELADVVSREIGKLAPEALGEVRKTRQFLSYYASLGRFPTGQILDDVRPSSQVVVRREPRGVVALITPWNDPVLTAARKLCPALLAGNAVILKPAPEATLSALALARIFEEAGLPGGVLNVVTGQGDEVGGWLVDAIGIDAISFTGSTEVGLAIQRAVAGRNVPVQAEMGGKNTLVVLDDADVAAALDAIVEGAFVQAGQRCTATSRVVVEQKRYDEVLLGLNDRVSKLRVGSAQDATSQMGPVITDERRDAILAHLDEPGLAGASTLCQAMALQDPAHLNGTFLSPGLVADVPSSSQLWSSELFGPVLAVCPAAGLSEAIDLVNDTPYGLAASVFTQDIDAVAEFSALAEVGCVAVNLPTAGWDVHVPFGGFKLSGSAAKEQGLGGIDFYSRLKTVAVRTNFRSPRQSDNEER